MDTGKLNEFSKTQCPGRPLADHSGFILQLQGISIKVLASAT